MTARVSVLVRMTNKYRCFFLKGVLVLKPPDNTCTVMNNTCIVVNNTCAVANNMCTVPNNMCTVTSRSTPTIPEYRFQF